MRKLGAKQSLPELNAATMEHIVNTLFPNQDLEKDQPDYKEETSCPPFTLEGMSISMSTLKTNNALGPYGIPVEVLKLIETERPPLLLSMYNACLDHFSRSMEETATDPDKQRQSKLRNNFNIQIPMHVRHSSKAA